MFGMAKPPTVLLWKSTVVVVGVGLFIYLSSRSKRPQRKRAITGVPHCEYRGPGDWFQFHTSFNIIAKNQKVRLLFLGDTATFHWNDIGKDVWNEFYGDVST